MNRIVLSDADAIPGPNVAIGIVILSDVRFVREALVAIFERSGKLNVLGAATELGSAFEQSLARQPDIVLIDTILPDGRAAVRRISQLAPEARIVALSLTEREDEVLAWVEAGVSAYIPRSAALEEMVPILEGAMRGEQICSPRVASSLVRRLAAGTSRERIDEWVALTRRELEIVQLIDQGLTNKEIAYRLEISLATAKSHVHNALAKLGLERRSQAARWAREQIRTPGRTAGSEIRVDTIKTGSSRRSITAKSPSPPSDG
jgi:two-component system, NarL family, nitrate/nitrite response regulator NarL